jgi:hypothetical protein
MTMSEMEIGTRVRSSEGRTGTVIPCPEGDPLCGGLLEFVRWDVPFFVHGDVSLTDSYASAKHLTLSPDDFEQGLLNYSYDRGDDTVFLRVRLRNFADPDRAAQTVLDVCDRLAAQLDEEAE